MVLEVVVSESVFGILVVKERKDEWRRKRFCEGVYKRRKSESSIASMRDEANGPVRVRPNPRPKRVVQIRSVQFRSVPLRQNKRNNKPNHKQFIIHESINTHSTEQDELPAAKQRKVADTNGRLLHDTAQMAHLSCVGQKAMDDVIRQNVEQETENSVNDVSAFISKNKMNDDF